MPGPQNTHVEPPRAVSRVLLVTHYFPAHGGGVERVAGELATRLVATGECSITWMSSDTNAAPVIPGLRTMAVPAWNILERRLSVPMPIWSARGLARLWRATAEADVIHIHDTLYPGNFCAAIIAFVRRKPLIVTQHIGMAAYRSRVLRGLVAAANRVIAAPILRNARQVIFISAAVNDYFDRRVHWKRSPRLLPNGVDLELFRPPSSTERTAARERLGLEDHQPVFIFIGRLVEKKGLPVVESLVRAIPEALWLIAGQGPIDPGQWGCKNVRVFHDRSGTTLRELIWASDLLLLPSSSEGFPLVVQEAAACGLTSLVTAEIADGYPPSHDAMLLEPLGPGAVQRWSVRLRDFIASRRVPMNGPTLARFAREHWDWQATVQAYLRMLAECTRR